MSVPTAGRSVLRTKSPPKPYLAAGPKARYFKAIIQMSIGVLSLIGICTWMAIKVIESKTGVGSVALFSNFPSAHDLSDGLFAGVGLALGGAAVVELAYTLFTDGPDEALNPVMLGVAAALLIQLGQVDEFKVHEALAGLFYAVALAILFAARKWLAEPEDKESWSLVDFWRTRRNRRQLPPIKPWNAPGYADKTPEMTIDRAVD